MSNGRKWVKVGDFMFMGEYHYTIDEKGRITIPSKLRENLSNEFIVTRGLDKCLFIYTKEEWNNIIIKYKELPNTRDARNFMRFLMSGANVSECDKMGRIKLMNPLIDYAGIKKECVIIGVSDHIEIWDKSQWNELLTTNFDKLESVADNLFISNIGR